MLRSEKNRVLALDSELKAQKILLDEIVKAHKSELDKYARPDLLIKKLIHLADESEAADQHLDSFVTTYSIEQKTEMAKAVHRLFLSVERMKKRLFLAEQATRPSTTERAQLLPFQKARQSVNASQ